VALCWPASTLGVEPGLDRWFLGVSWCVMPLFDDVAAWLASARVCRLWARGRNEMMGCGL
jgi:hypothetical protein